MTVTENSYQHQLHDLFSLTHRNQLYFIIHTAYDLRNAVYACPAGLFLRSTGIGMNDIKSHLLRAGIEYAAVSLARKGTLVFDAASCRDASNGANHYVSLILSGCRIYFARLQNEGSKPEKRDYRLPFIKNSPYLSLFETPGKPPCIQDYPIVVAYGDNGDMDCQFCLIGICGEEGWIYKEPLMRPDQHMIHEPDAIDEEILVGFSDFAKLRLQKEKNDEAN